MPLFYQHNINDFVKLGIWEITEEEDFFLSYVPISRAVTHPHKRLQHLAGRFLLPFLFDDFPLAEIQIADTKRPYLEKEAYHFSISHCGNYAAAIVSKYQRVGIDIELVSPKIQRVQHKFLGNQEYDIAIKNISSLRELFPQIDDQLLTLLWSSKESLFKWYARGQVDFKEHMQLTDKIIPEGNNHLRLPFVFDKEDAVNLDVRASLFNDLVLSWVVH